MKTATIAAYSNPKLRRPKLKVFGAESARRKHQTSFSHTWEENGHWLEAHYVMEVITFAEMEAMPEYARPEGRDLFFLPGLGYAVLQTVDEDEGKAIFRESHEAYRQHLAYRN